MCGRNKIGFFLIPLAFLFGLVCGLIFAGQGLFSPFAKPASFPVQPPVFSEGDKEANGITNTKTTYEEGYSAAIEYAQKRMASTDWISHPLTTLSGAIKSIDGKNITIEYQAVQENILKEGLAIKSFLLADSTLIERHTPKTQEQIQEAVAKAPSETEGFSLGLLNLDNYNVEKLQLSDLKVGDVVHIETANDIRLSANIDVSAIIINNN
jgi:hypothetical protein